MADSAPSDATPPRLSLLGSPRLFDAGAGRYLPLNPKLALLAACLAVAADRGARRGHLAMLLWPDRGEEQARGSLRNALSRLRALGVALVAEGDTVTLATTTDLARLAHAAGTAVDPDSALALAAPLLEGVEPGSGEMEDWLGVERGHCLSLAQRALDLACTAAIASGEVGSALIAAQRLVALDPCREGSHRLLMRLHAARGDRAAALAQYRACRALLRAELGVAPDDETEALARALAAPAAPEPAVAREDFRVSIAVLAFDHAADDPDAQFLAEGVADDIVTELTRHRDFLVMARSTSMRFASAAALAQDLGVRYTVTGELRRVGTRVSLSARLVDETLGRSLWAVRHEGAIDDFFTLRDRLIGDLADRLDAEIRMAERERAVATPPASLGAWGLYHRGMWHAFRFGPAEADRAEDCFTRALGLAPDFALAHAGLAYLAILRAVMLMDPDPAARLAAGLVHARDAFEHDPVSPFVLMVYGRLLLMHGARRQGFDLLLLGRDRHPSYAHLHYCLALSHHGEGEPELALAAIDKAIRLSPRDPLMSMFLTVRAGSHYFCDRPEPAEADARAALDCNRGDIWAATVLALVLAEKGETAQARALLSGPDGAFPAQSGTTIWPLIERTIAPAALDRVRRALALMGFQDITAAA